VLLLLLRLLLLLGEVGNKKLFFFGALPLLSAGVGGFVFLCSFSTGDIGLLLTPA